MLVKTANIMGMVPLTDAEHSKLLNDDLKWSAITKTLVPVIIAIILLIIFITYRRKRRKRSAKA
jgi:hypothetical protein